MVDPRWQWSPTSCSSWHSPAMMSSTSSSWRSSIPNLLKVSPVARNGCTACGRIVYFIKSVRELICFLSVTQKFPKPVYQRNPVIFSTAVVSCVHIPVCGCSSVDRKRWQWIFLQYRLIWRRHCVHKWPALQLFRFISRYYIYKTRKKEKRCLLSMQFGWLQECMPVCCARKWYETPLIDLKVAVIAEMWW